MPAPTPYLFFPGTAHQALSFYASVFGGTATAHSFAELGNSDGPADAVELFAADVTGGQASFGSQGLMFSLLGTADAETLRGWFAGLSDGGTVVDDLQQRPWGAVDGQVIDRYGIHWLVGFESDAAD